MFHKNYLLEGPIIAIELLKQKVASQTGVYFLNFAIIFYKKKNWKYSNS